MLHIASQLTAAEWLQIRKPFLSQRLLSMHVATKSDDLKVFATIQLAR